MEVLDSYERKGYTVKIFFDDIAEDPRLRDLWDNIGTMVCWHPRYTLGDSHNYPTPGVVYEEDSFYWRLASELDSSLGDWFDDLEYRLEEEADPEDKGLPLSEWEKVEEELNRRTEERVADILKQKAVILPLYLYDHSGITMSTSRFSCPWDSGQVGYIFVPLKRAREEFRDMPDNELREKAREALRAEVEVYDKYISGQVFMFLIEDEDGEIVDSCGGFFDRESLEDMANNWIDGEVHFRAVEGVLATADLAKQNRVYAHA
jgi:hypothetical protein